MIKKIIKRFLTVKNNDNELILQLKEKFKHDLRKFYHGNRLYFADCLDCDAVPGVVEVVLSNLQHINCKNLLSLGAGTKGVSQMIETLGVDVYNVDIVIEKEDNKNIAFDLNSRAKLPYEDNFFDVVLCQEIIEHIHDPWSLISLAKKVLKDDGYLIVTTPNISSKYSKKKFCKTGYFHWFTNDCLSYHINPIPFFELELIIKQNGMCVDKLTGNSNYFWGDSNNKNKTLAYNEGIVLFCKKII